MADRRLRAGDASRGVAAATSAAAAAAVARAWAAGRVATALGGVVALPGGWGVVAIDGHLGRPSVVVRRLRDRGLLQLAVGAGVYGCLEIDERDVVGVRLLSVRNAAATAAAAAALEREDVSARGHSFVSNTPLQETHVAGAWAAGRVTTTLGRVVALSGGRSVVAINENLVRGLGGVLGALNLGVEGLLVGAGQEAAALIAALGLRVVDPAVVDGGDASANDVGRLEELRAVRLMSLDVVTGGAVEADLRLNRGGRMVTSAPVASRAGPACGHAHQGQSRSHRGEDDEVEESKAAAHVEAELERRRDSLGGGDLGGAGLELVDGEGHRAGDEGDGEHLVVGFGLGWGGGGGLGWLCW